MATIEMDDNTKRFYQGIASGDEVTKAHADTDFPDFQTRERMWWFFVGALAAGNHGCSTTEDFEHFVRGAALRAPSQTEGTMTVEITYDPDNTESSSILRLLTTRDHIVSAKEV